MSSKATINARIDPATKAQALNILHSLGLNTTQAISLFFKQIIYTNGIPFELKLPNETTVETFRKTDSAQDLHRVSSVTELAKELKS
ncbi:MAG: type II toxin-antitoxin system antitoxin, RelB/DinJ family [Planctomycetota bacterium]|jgi:DNA-damage-inducible protein J|nr:MAG: type II toxin-antitoxin system antitoxin, RelB/DinJ family [Planctomycetota bacterium]